ncbi:MAG: glutamate--tRNA ligase [Planctomycetota bacterium]|nr:MAG: glutamate--tRNA ligase [Planctomycetota bacterium]
MSERPVRTRIAPSPTGDPHVGTAYMGLVNMVHARQHGGSFVLRIDDTDRTRYRHGSEEQIFEALRWLGLEWDEGPDKGGAKGPYRQSERTAIYREHTELLLERGGAYRCFCTPERLAKLRAEQQARKERTRYDNHCRELDPEESARRAAAGEPHVVRLKMPLEGSVVVEDLLRGPIELKQDNFQDQVLVKQDGFPTYHMASVIDDHLFEISHIIRAEEWISSAATHKVLFEAFGWEMPVLCHMPLLRNHDKSKISKRKNPTSILYYREAGFLPAGLLNFLALMGWGGPKNPDGSCEEIFGLDAMLEHFRLEEVSLGGPVFDLEKLRYVNGRHLRALPSDAYVEAVRGYLFAEDKLRRVCALAQPRTETLGEFLDVTSFFFGRVEHATPETRKRPLPEREPVAGLVPKGRSKEETWFALRIVQEALDRLDPWHHEALEETCRALASEEETGWKARELFMTLRVVMTGRTESPGLFETMELIGKPRGMGRLGDAMRLLGEPGKKKLKKWEKAREARRRSAAGGGAVRA